MPTETAELRTEKQEIETESERSCPSNLLTLSETGDALLRWSRKLRVSFESLSAAGREFVDYYTRREGREQTRKDWIGALVTYLRDLHAKGQLGAVASQQEHREVVPITLAEIFPVADVTRSALRAATPLPSVKGAPTPGSSTPSAAGAAE